MSQAITHDILRLRVAAENERPVAKAARPSRAAPWLPTHESSAFTRLDTRPTAHPTYTRCWGMPQVISCDIHQLHVQLDERLANFVWHLGMSWRHLTPHKRNPNNHSKREVPASLVQASASLAHQAIYLCGKPFDSSHFDAIAEAD